MSGKTIKIFTDGSFKKLKNTKALCGYGIYFPNGELDNVSRPFIHEPLTNQRAELYAILKSLRNLEKEKINYDEVIIYTDSEYSIKSVTIWYKTWEKNKWKNAKGQAVMNQDIIRPIINILKDNLGKIKFKHVNSHTGKQDFESLSNEMADKLANEGAMKTILK
jgi:ribonuclease HI